MIDTTKAYWGMQNTTTATSLIADRSVIDLLRMRPLGTNRLDPSDDDFAERGPGFSLDNVCFDTDTQAAYYNGGLIGAPFWGYRQGAGVYDTGRVLGKSMTAVSGAYTETLDQNYNRFTVPMFGGFDGFDIAEKNHSTMSGHSAAKPPLHLTIVHFQCFTQ